MVALVRRAPLGCVALLVVAAVAPRSVAQYATPVAIRGQVAPDAGGNVFSGFERPAINDIGQVAFYGQMLGQGEAGDQVAGVFVTRRPSGVVPQLTGSVLQGTLTEVALFAGPTPPNATGDQPLLDPNLNPQVFYAAFGTEVAIATATTAAGGEVAFFGTGATRNTVNGTVRRLTGIFAGVPPQPPSMRTVALDQTAGPDIVQTINGTNFIVPTNWRTFETPPAHNDPGQTAFWATVSNPNLGLEQTGIFRNTPGGATVEVAVTGRDYTSVGNISPSTTVINFSGFGDDREPAMNNFGTVAFYASINNTAFPAGIFRWDGGNNAASNGLTAVAVQNASFDGNPNNIYLSIGQTVTVSEAGGGLVAFKATVVTPTTPGAGDSGIFAQPSPGVPAVKVALTRDNIGGVLTGYSTLYPAGLYPANYPPNVANQEVHYVEFFSDIAQNRGGWLAYGASLSPGDGGGIFFATPGTYTQIAVALAGNPAPGAGPGVTYGGFRTTPLALNAHNGVAGPPEVAFIATLAGLGVDGTNDLGLFMANGVATTDPNVRETVLLARSGDPLIVAPGVTKTIRDFGSVTNPAFYSSVGKGRDSINDNGQVSVVVNFDDNTSGVYVFTPDLRIRDTAFPTVPPTAVAFQWEDAPRWTFGYNPARGIYKVIIDPADASDKFIPNPPTLPDPPITDVTVTNVGAGSGSETPFTLPGLTVGGATGRAHVVLAGGANVRVGVTGVTDGSEVLTLRSGTAGLGVSDITGGLRLELRGDIRSLAGATTAVIGTTLELGLVPIPPGFPLTNVPPIPTAATPSIRDIDRFRTITVDRGDFTGLPGPGGLNPIDLRIDGQIITRDIVNVNEIHRGLIKAGPGTLQLTANNASPTGPDFGFGPNTAITDDPWVNDPPPGSPLDRSYVQSIKVLDGILSVSADNNLGIAPGTPKFRWIELNGGALQSTASFTINPNRGIALGPTSGEGNGTIDVFGAATTLTYAGVVSDNAAPVLSENGTVLGITTGLGSLTKTGTGTLVLSNPLNTYRGGTTVNRGTLVVAGDGSLGLSGTAVAVNAPGALTYMGSTTTTREFTMTGTLSVAAGSNLNFNSTTVDGGTLAGPGTFSTVAGGSTVFTGNTTSPSATLTLNGADALINFTNGGQLTVPATPPSTGAPLLTRFTNLASGSVTVGASTQINVSEFQSAGVVTLNPGTTTVPTQLNNVGAAPLFFGGGSRTFIATPATAPQFAAGIDLRGQNLIVAGGLLVNNGFIIDTAPGGPGRVIVDYGGRVKGVGFYQSPVITQNGGVFQIGNSPGRAQFGDFTFGPGGTSAFTWQINNATGTAGPTPDANNQVSGWSVVEAVTQIGPFGPFPGSFSWTATPAQKLTFSLETLLNPTTVGNDVAGPMANFNPDQSFTWLVVTYAGAYTGPTANSDLNNSTTFDTSAFLNPINGSFGWNLDTTARTLSLVYTPVPVPEPVGVLFACGAAAAGWWRWRRRK